MVNRRFDWRHHRRLRLETTGGSTPMLLSTLEISADQKF
jgi:hypothetical protein